MSNFIKILEKLKSVPEWVKWQATDSDGTITGFEDKPVFRTSTKKDNVVIGFWIARGPVDPKKGEITLGKTDKPKNAENTLMRKGLGKLSEGMTKKALEDKIEKMCNCDGGASLDPDEHETTCPAYDKLVDGDYGSDDMDKAEYDRGDR